MHKKTFLYLVIVILFLCSYPSFTQEIPDGPYFGQKPPGKTPEIFAPGIISQKERMELSASFSPDGKEFSLVVIDKNSKTPKSDIFYTKQDNGHWSKLDTAYFAINKGPYTHVRFSPNGMILSYNLFDPVSNTADIWIVERDGQKWSNPKKLPSPINTDSHEGGHSFTMDQTLYFTSNNRFGKKTKGDIYRSEFKNNTYSSAEKILILSTDEYDEDGVYVSPDEKFVIFYSLNRPVGFGLYDLYISFKTKDDSWTIPQNMGEIINTDGSETQPFLSPDMKYLFFTRFNKNESDIYWIDASIIDELKRKSDILKED